ncbi:MAG: DUF6116 family protein [Vicinamibacterales bacterium]
MGLPTQGLFDRFLGDLRTPTLFKLAFGLFLVDLVVPDMVPFMDEIFLGLLTMLAARRKPRP